MLKSVFLGENGNHHLLGIPFKFSSSNEKNNKETLHSKHWNRLWNIASFEYANETFSRLSQYVVAKGLGVPMDAVTVCVSSSKNGRKQQKTPYLDSIPSNTPAWKKNWISAAGLVSKSVLPYLTITGLRLLENKLDVNITTGNLVNNSFRAILGTGILSLKTMALSAALRNLFSVRPFQKSTDSSCPFTHDPSSKRVSYLFSYFLRFASACLAAKLSYTAMLSYKDSFSNTLNLITGTHQSELETAYQNLRSEGLRNSVKMENEISDLKYKIAKQLEEIKEAEYQISKIQESSTQGGFHAVSQEEMINLEKYKQSIPKMQENVVNILKKLDSKENGVCVEDLFIREIDLLVSEYKNSGKTEEMGLLARRFASIQYMKETGLLNKLFSQLDSIPGQKWRVP